jgi:Fe-S cluster assembly protein SufD
MLKDKILSSYLAFENNSGLDMDSPVRNIRKNALDQFESVGFPTKSIEEWKYTSLKELLKNDYKILKQAQNEIDTKLVKPFLLKGIESYKLVFLNGVYQPQVSETSHDGMDICILSSAMQNTKYKIVFDHYFNTIASKTDGLTSLNTAFIQEGAFIHIPKGVVVSKPIEILYLTTGKDSDVMVQPRNLVIVDENAYVQIVERHQSLTAQKVFSNSVTEIITHKRAILEWYKVQNDHLLSSLIDSTYVVQKEQSVVSMFTFSFGGDLVRNNMHVYHEGEHITSNLNGISMLHGTQHVDHQTNIYHQQPNCESHELYKGIFDEQSTGVFNGKVIVSKEAQKTDAYQQNDNILLTDEATINAKPQLEIFADDVKCSHGCTVGQLDKNALFYMRQRGIPAKEAQALLLYAFTDQVVNRIKIPALKDWITRNISEKLGVQLEIEL